MPEFVQLHNHSDASYAIKADGCSKVQELLNRAKELKLSGMALTDHGTMMNVITGWKYARDIGIKFIPGMEAYMVRDVTKMRQNLHNDEDEADSRLRFHITLLAMNRTGYRNLLKLHEESYRNFYYKPNIDLKLLNDYNEGIICLSGCPLSMVGKSLFHGDKKTAVDDILTFKSIFGDRYYGEVQRVGFADSLADTIYDIFDSFGIKCVASNDTHFAHKEDNMMHDVAICMNKGQILWDETRKLKSCPETYLKSPEEMAAIFSDMPDVISNSLEILERCDIDLKQKSLMPSFPVPESNLAIYKEKAPEEDPVYCELVQWAREGFKKRLPHQLKNPVYVERMKMELAMIKEMGFHPYFLVVSDFIRWAKSVGIPVGPGRGSAGGSLLCYCLDITDIDPIVHGLIFERFLNPGRKLSPPDIDTDFAKNRRQEVIDYVKGKYGNSNVASIGTFNKFNPRGTIRAIARVIKVADSVADAIAKSIPSIPGITFKTALKESPKFEEYYNRAQNPETNEDKLLKVLFEMAFKFEGNKSHVGRHAAGVAMAPEGTEVSDFLPLMNDGKDFENFFTAVDMKGVEEVLIKMDFLGLENLDIMDATIRNSGIESGYTYVRENCDIHDPNLYQDIYKKQNTAGMFQFDTDPMVAGLKVLGGDNFNDLVIAVAAVRPGAKDYIQVMADVKFGKKEAQYDHPMLEPILKDTYGVILYQEQALFIFQQMAGFNLTEADLARRAMGKKIQSEMDALGDKFIEGSVKNGIPKETAQAIFAKIQKFAEYSFNKAHSVAYAITAAHTAYCKTYFTEQFLAECINFAHVNEYKHFIQECKRLGIPVLPPDVNYSKAGCTVEVFDPSKHKKHTFFDVLYSEIPKGTKCIRMGYECIKDITSGLNIQNTKKYDNVFDFFSKNKRIPSDNVEVLICSGAFDCFGVSRSDLLFNKDSFVAMAKESKNQSQNQTSMFDFFDKEQKQDYMKLKSSGKKTNNLERLAWENEYLGYIFTSSFKEAFKSKMQETNAITVSEYLNKYGNVTSTGNEVINFVGVVYNCRVYRKQLKDAEGNKVFKPMLFASVGDFEDKVEVQVFEEALKKSADRMKTTFGENMVAKNDLVMVSGKIGRSGRLFTNFIEVLER